METQSKAGRTCQCGLCRREYTYTRRGRGTLDTCPSCFGGRHRFHLKAFMVDYKGGACQLCGYKACLRSLDFHHVDPDQKDFHLAGNHTRSWASLRGEIDKCVCLCRNCHGEVHEALDRLAYGHTDNGIIDTVKSVHASWTPDHDMVYSRIGWETYHPAFIV